METISNEEKIEELAEKSPINWISKEDKCTYRQGFVCGATKIAKWKDEQHAKEKARWIDKAVDFISKRFYIGINNHITSKEDYYTLTELIRDFEQTMKRE